MHKTRYRSRPLAIVGSWLIAALWFCMGADPAFCQLDVSGSWRGTWQSSRVPAGGLLNVSLAQVGTRFSGSIIITGSPFFTVGNVSGSVSGTNIAFGSVFSGGFVATFSGTITPTRVSGFYTATGPGLNDFGTFQVSRPTPAVQGTRLLPKSRVTTVAEPINVADGNMFMVQEDISIPARGLPLELIRTYNSRDPVDGRFGFGWRSSYDIELLEFADGSVLETDAEGTQTLYTRQPDGSYVASLGTFSRLTKSPDGSFTLVQKHGLRLAFDGQGRLSGIRDRNGNALTISYVGGVLSRVTDSSGRSLHLLPNAQGKVSEVRDPGGRVFRYEYDANGNLMAFIDPLGQRTQYQYDADHNLNILIDANGHTTHFAYDALDRATASFQEGNTNRIDLHYVNPTTTIATDSQGHRTTYEFNAFGLVTRLTDPQDHTQQSTYDADLNRLSFTDQNSHTTTFTYDQRGNLLSVTDPFGHHTTFSYEPVFDFVTSITDPLGRTTTYAYDPNGNLMRVTDALGQTTAFTFDAFGNLTGIIDALGHGTSFTYDTVGNLTQLVDALANLTAFVHDLLGNPVSITDANGNTTRFTYDLLDRLTAITYPDGCSVGYAYDAVGNLLRFTDPKGQTTLYTYDLADRLVQVTDALGGLTRYEYDTEGNRTGIIDANSSATRYLYDSLNRLIKTIDPLGHETQFTYDPAGNLTARTDANGHTTGFAYDVNNRLARIRYPDGASVSFGYDAVGNRIAMTDAQGTTAFTYDALNWLVRLDGPQASDTVNYAYDAVGNRTSMTDPDGGVTTYTYDALNRLVNLTDTQSRITTYTYDAVSNLTELALPNQTKTTYTYNQLNRLIQLTNLRPNGHELEPISSFASRYDPAGLRTQITLENGDGINYSYDALNRLIGEVKRKAEPTERVFFSNQFQYDVVGNRTQLNRQLDQRPPFAVTGTVPDPFQLPGEATFAYTYNAANQLTQVLITREDETFLVTYTYDANGNLVNQTIVNPEEPKKVVVTAYTHDFENRLTQVSLPDGSTVRYTYDGLGRRVGTEANGEITEFLYDGLLPILERNGDGRTTAHYTGGLSLGGGIGGLLSAKGLTETDEPLFYHYDGQGNVTELTDEEGEVVQDASYDAFGNLMSLENDKDVTNPYLFSTKELDLRTGFSYFGARYYDPRIGRFITPDPLTWGPDDPRVIEKLRLGDLIGLDPDFLTLSMVDTLEIFKGLPIGERLLVIYRPAVTEPLQANRYIYVLDNPLNFIDPFGLAAQPGIQLTRAAFFSPTLLAPAFPLEPETGFNSQVFLAGKRKPGRIPGGGKQKPGRWHPQPKGPKWPQPKPPPLPQPKPGGGKPWPWPWPR